MSNPTESAVADARGNCFLLLFLLFELLHTRAGRNSRKPAPLQAPQGRATQLVWLWRELTSCAVRMPRYEGRATALLLLLFRIG